MAQAAPTFEPTLAQRLRVIDLTFECVTEAERQLVAAGEISPFRRSNPCGSTERGRRIGELSCQLRAEAMEREGLPLSLLGDGRSANQRHFERMNRDFGTPLPWAATAVRAAA